MLKPRLLKQAEVSGLPLKKTTALALRRQPPAANTAEPVQQPFAPARSAKPTAPRAKAGAQTWQRQTATQRITNPRAAFAALFKQEN